MFPKAVEYSKPVQKFARLCGTLPVSFPPDSPVSKYYLVYSLVLITLSANSYTRGSIYSFNYYKDIVCFTCILADVTTFGFHAAAILTPLSLTKTYSKLFGRLEYLENLIHSLNITQKQIPTKCCIYTWISYVVALIVLHCYITFYTFRINLIEGVGFIACYTAFNVCVIHLLQLLLVVKSKLVSVNWHLDYLNNKVPVYLVPPDDKIFIENKIHGEDVAEKFVNYSTDVRRVTVDKIKAFNQIHFLLYSSCNLIAKYFSLQILLFVLAAVLQGMKLFIMVFDPDIVHTSLKVTFMIYVINGLVFVFSVADVFHKIKSEVRNRSLYTNCDLIAVRKQLICICTAFVICFDSRRGQHFWSVIC